jgi:hypothetical protein
LSRRIFRGLFFPAAAAARAGEAGVGGINDAIQDPTALMKKSG